MTSDPRAALRDLAGDHTHLHDRCHEREAALAGLLAEARDLIDRHVHAPEAPQNSDFTDLRIARAPRPSGAGDDTAPDVGLRRSWLRRVEQLERDKDELAAEVTRLRSEAAALRDADRIVTELCDEYGVERGELVDRVNQDRAVSMAFDSLVYERERELRDAGNELSEAARNTVPSKNPELVDWVRLDRACKAWRAAAGGES